MRFHAIILASLAAITLAGCEVANDGPIKIRPNETAHDGLPPKRFQGDVDVGVRFVANPAAECYEAGAKYLGGELRGCVVEVIYRNKVTNELFSNYTMIVKNPCLEVKSRRDALWDYCHEIGHVNTWSGRHEA